MERATEARENDHGQKQKMKEKEREKILGGPRNRRVQAMDP